MNEIELTKIDDIEFQRISKEKKIPLNLKQIPHTTLENILELDDIFFSLKNKKYIDICNEKGYIENGFNPYNNIIIMVPENSGLTQAWLDLQYDYISKLELIDLLYQFNYTTENGSLIFNNSPRGTLLDEQLLEMTKKYTFTRRVTHPLFLAWIECENENLQNRCSYKDLLVKFDKDIKKTFISLEICRKYIDYMIPKLIKIIDKAPISEKNFIL